MDEQQMIVFIGGCADGQRRILPNSVLNRRWVSMVNMQGIMEHGRVMPSEERYRLEKFIDQDKGGYIVAVYEGERQPFRLLLEGYRKSAPPSQE